MERGNSGNMISGQGKDPLGLIFALSLTVSVLVQCSVSFAAYDDAKGFRVAGDLLNQGSYLEAMAAYQEIVTHSESYENRAKGLYFMGTIYSLFLDQYDEALQLYQLLLRDYSKSTSAQDALFNTGMVLYEKGAFAEALRSFQRYLSQYPTGRHKLSAEVWAASAKAQAETGKPTAPASVPRLTVDDTILRVLVRDKVSAVTLNAATPITISGIVPGNIVHECSRPLNLTAETGRLFVNGEDLKVSRCTASSMAGILSIDGKPYRGIFRVLAENDKMIVINDIDVEAYLYGVVPREMPPKWAEEALKAQAVAARTYALYIKEKSSDKSYDLVATTASQVYGGYDAEAPATNRTVDSTTGEVMTHNGRLMIAYFHANSGGFTESASNVWVADLPYLKAIRDPYSDNVPNGTWDLSLSYETMQDRLNQYGLNVGPISQVRPIDISLSGRPVRIAIVLSSGPIELKSNDFRLKIGASKLKSALFRLQESAGSININGKGSGHGVGMSQWGAYRMAQAGHSYRDILKHYYKGVEVRRLKPGR
jgi:stage II sporulation protein D